MNKYRYLKAKHLWVKSRVYSYGVNDPKLSGGAFYISPYRVNTYSNGFLDQDLEQLRDRSDRMGFEKGFWFLRSKAKELGYKFSFVKRF